MLYLEAFAIQATFTKKLVHVRLYHIFLRHFGMMSQNFGMKLFSVFCEIYFQAN